MKQVICPNCSQKCIRHGVLKSGSQRWFCKSCKIAFTNKLSTAGKELHLFLYKCQYKNVQK